MLVNTWQTMKSNRSPQKCQCLFFKAEKGNELNDLFFEVVSSTKLENLMDSNGVMSYAS